MPKNINEIENEYHEFSYIISHDLSAVIRQLCSFSKLLADSIKGDLSAQQSEYTEIISSISNKAERMLDALKYFSHLSATDWEMKNLDLNLPLKDAITKNNTRIQKTKTIIHADFLPTTVGNHELFTEFFSHLIQNAISAQKHNEAVKIHVGTENINQTQHVFVQDNGTGFDPSKIDTALTMFRSLQKNDGLGTGLTFAKKIVEIHNSIMFINTSPDMGTKISFTLTQ